MAAAKPRRQYRLGLWVHDIGGRVEIEALLVMDLTVACDQRIDARANIGRARACGAQSNALNASFALVRHPRAGQKGGGHGFGPFVYLGPLQ